MKKIIKNLDKTLLVTTIILFAVGLIMVFSSSNVTAFMTKAVSPYNYFLKQSLFLIVGIILSIIMLCFSTESYNKFSKGLMIFIIIALAGLPFFGIEVNHAKSWYDLKVFSFQPSEFMKVISIVWLAAYYEKNKKNLDRTMSCLLPLGICAIAAGLTFIQPDLGTTIIYMCIVAGMFIISPTRKDIKSKIIFGTIGFVFFIGTIFLGAGKSLILERQKERITEFRNPCDKLLTTGNQVCNAYIAFNNGGLTGKGLGNSTQKYLYLPEPYTDFIFAIIVEELGLIFGVGILLAYVIVIIRILQIGKQSYTNSNAMICFGIALYIIIHICVNLLGLFGLIPMTGVPLPFMSYGGSFTICLVAALTIVQRINVENKLTKEKIEEKIRSKK